MQFSFSRRSSLVGALCLLALAGCTSVQVDPLSSAPAVMCIRFNPKVQVDDFVTVLQQGFSRHGIEAQLYKGAIPHRECPYLVTYSARRSWDMAPYLSQAEVRILDAERRQVASAQYHLRGKGGLSMMKWQGTEAKMTPVIDQLLAGVEVQRQVPAPRSDSVGTGATLSYEQRLDQLRQEQLSYAEYMQRFRDLNQEFGR